MKITFVGDVMCERPLLRGAKRTGIYQFDNVFAGTKGLFDESDLVIANLESPFAGKEAQYTKDLFSFNTPVEFLDSLAKSGIDVVQTANNHCLDRGTDGLIKTMEELQTRNITYFGTALEKEKKYLIRNIGKTKIALLGYTLTTNFSRNRVMIDESNEYLVNLVMPVDKNVYGRQMSTGIKSKISRSIPGQWKLNMKRLMGKNVREIRVDKLTDSIKSELYLEQIEQDIVEARKEADMVFCCLHMGGQFNSEPGDLVQYIVDDLSKTEVDAIICSHPHVIQKISMCNGKPCVFSLGNYSMSPSSPYLALENLPEYGLALHVYIEDKKIEKITITVLKMKEDRNKMLTVRPVNEVYSEADEAEKKNIEYDMGILLKRIGVFLDSEKYEEYINSGEILLPVSM